MAGQYGVSRDVIRRVEEELASRGWLIVLCRGWLIVLCRGWLIVL